MEEHVTATAVGTENILSQNVNDFELKTDCSLKMLFVFEFSAQLSRDAVSIAIIISLPFVFDSRLS